MAQGYFSGIGKISRISFGIVYVFFTLWLIFHTSKFVPAGQEDFWFKVFIGYGVLNSMVIGNADLRNKLFNVKLTDFVPRFAIFFAAGFVAFYMLMQYVDPLQTSAFDILDSVPIWLVAIHALVFATTESVVWQGYLDDKIGHPWSELTAGIFHWGIWSGGAVSVILGAGTLFAVFSYVNYRFKKDSNDLAPAIGVHTAFNVVKLGIYVLLGGML